MADNKLNPSYATAETPEELLELQDWWRKHGNTVTTIAIVVLLVVVGFQFLARRRAEKAAEASMAFANAVTTEEKEHFLATYSSSPLAPIQQLALANDYYHQKEYDKALAAYDSFLTRYGSNGFAPTAMLGRGQCFEAMGEFDKAAEIYEKFEADYAMNEASDDPVLQKGDKYYLAPEAILGRARCAIFQGKKAEARSILDLLLAKRPLSVWSSRTEELLAAIDRMTFVKPEPAAALDNVLDAINAIGEVEEAPAPETKPEE